MAQEGNRHRSILKAKDGKCVTVLWFRGTPKLCAKEHQSGQEPSMFTETRHEGKERQMTFHFEYDKYLYYPKVEHDGKNSFKLGVKCYTENQGVLEDKHHWFKFVNIGGSEHTMLQSVVSPDYYVSISREDSSLVLSPTKDNGAEVTVEDILPN